MGHVQNKTTVLLVALLTPRFYPIHSIIYDTNLQLVKLLYIDESLFIPKIPDLCWNL